MIEADEQENRLVLSAREVLREKAQEEKLEKIQSIKVGSIVEGTCRIPADLRRFH